MPKIVHESDDGVREVTVSELKYKEDTGCWWYYLEAGSNRARYVPRERVFYVERGD